MVVNLTPALLVTFSVGEENFQRNKVVIKSGVHMFLHSEFFCYHFHRVNMDAISKKAIYDSVYFFAVDQILLSQFRSLDIFFG